MNMTEFAGPTPPRRARRLPGIVLAKTIKLGLIKHEPQPRHRNPHAQTRRRSRGGFRPAGGPCSPRPVFRLVGVGVLGRLAGGAPHAWCLSWLVWGFWVGWRAVFPTPGVPRGWCGGFGSAGGRCSPRPVFLAAGVGV